jgi:hypothetical protein
MIDSNGAAPGVGTVAFDQVWNALIMTWFRAALVMFGETVRREGRGFAVFNP